MAKLGIQFDRITLPALFKQNGYYTVNLGKIFHRPEAQHNDHKAWDEFRNFRTTPTGEKGEREQNLFLAVGLAKPHDPYIAPRKYFDLYPLDEIKLPSVPDLWTEPFEHAFPLENPVFPRGKKIFNEFSDQEKREFLRSYYACISFMDAQLGELLKLENIPDYVEGQSFQRILLNPDQDFRTFVQSVMTRVDGSMGKSVKNSRWRYIEWENGQLGSELYDQENDPMEYINLAQSEEYAAVVGQMKILLAKK